MGDDWEPTPLPHTGDSVAPGFHIGYEVKDCEHGKGLFAKHFIPAHTLLWKYKAGPKAGAGGVNVLVYRDEAEARARLKGLPEEDRAFWVDHLYMDGGVLNEILDESKYWNHSDSPNCGGPALEAEGYDGMSVYSTKDIEAGEHMVDNYGRYLYPEWYDELCREYGVGREYFAVMRAPLASWAPTLLPHDDQSVDAGFHVHYEKKACAFGEGLFAKHFIPKGTLLWKCKAGPPGTPGVNVFSFEPTEEAARARLKELPEEQRAYWVDHIYICEGSTYEIQDDGKLWNHDGEAPCSGTILPTADAAYCPASSYAMRDIEEGEQLLDDYGLYEYPAWYRKLLDEYDVDRSFVVVKSEAGAEHK